MRILQRLSTIGPDTNSTTNSDPKEGASDKQIEAAEKKEAAADAKKKTLEDRKKARAEREKQIKKNDSIAKAKKKEENN